jgi:hypothetical protein
MKTMIAYCGLNCHQCDAYLATRENDDNQRIEVARLWSGKFQMRLKPGDINCDGCLSRTGRMVPFCKSCEIRACALKNNVINCAHCDQYPCETLHQFIKTMPKARQRLDAIRKTLSA